MIETSFNGKKEDVASVDAFAIALHRYAICDAFELWLSADTGPSMCMLRNGQDAFLMYLRCPGDSGFTSVGDATAKFRVVTYALSNGQLEEYPGSWCLPVAQCFEAAELFFTRNGQRPECVAWCES
jgi:hypothetical protein